MARETQLLAHLSFAFPEKTEQEAIVQHVEEIERVIETEMLQLSKLALLKSGLMTDLLTGRVRVPEHYGVRRLDAAFKSGDPSPHSKEDTL